MTLMRAPAGLSYCIGHSGRSYYPDANGFLAVDPGDVFSLRQLACIEVTDAAPANTPDAPPAPAVAAPPSQETALTLTLVDPPPLEAAQGADTATPDTLPADG